MASKASKRKPADDQKRIFLEVFPYAGHAVCTVGLGYRDAGGVHRTRLAYWHLRLTRGDLAGRATDDVLRAIVKAIVQRLDDGPDPADRQSTGGAPGVPLGTAGGTVTEDTLPGL